MKKTMLLLCTMAAMLASCTRFSRTETTIVTECVVDSLQSTDPELGEAQNPILTTTTSMQNK